MKNWIRIFLVCFVLVGGTAFFAYQLNKQFNKTFDDLITALNNLSAASFSMAIRPSIPLSDKTNKEQIATPTPTPETISTLATSVDLKLSFIFPKKNSKVYIGCTYKISWLASTTIKSLKTTLTDANTNEIVEPIASGLAMENKIEPNSQSLNWKVGVVLPGEYYIKVLNINGVEFENYSNVFTISKIPKGISVAEREKICKESGS